MWPVTHSPRVAVYRSVLLSDYIISEVIQSTPDNSKLQVKQKKFELSGVQVIEGKML